MSIIYHVTIDQFSLLNSTANRGAYISYPEPSIFFVHFTNTMVFLYVSQCESGLFIVATYGAKNSIRVDYSILYSENKI